METLVPPVKKKKTFKKILKYTGLALCGVIVFVAITISINPEGVKYFLGSLIRGVPINTPVDLNRYAYGANIGWIDFNPTGGNVQVGDDGLAGYAYGENTGWINLDEVVHDGNGNLSGYAWGANIGWIDFNPTGGGVTINTSTGAFSGYAYGENTGWISFSGTNYGVITDWRPPVLGRVNNYTITVTTGVNGFISPNSVNLGQGGSQTFNIIPAIGYKIADVLVDLESVGAVATYTFSNVSARHTISATFSKIDTTPEVEQLQEQPKDQANTANYVKGILNQLNLLIFQNPSTETQSIMQKLLQTLKDLLKLNN